ncbi:BTB/POZ/MATH-domain protein [Rhynchospora pubera]|uniref:BTB/POZ/MATH-domain protein n=1 Tax=Rhynchospora pubera TaxID=906938 RepID=A0AAV8ERJ0_9POAL|nr:BTB/POZ/MATH-domain protein [Rhynchospora pubera]
MSVSMDGSLNNPKSASTRRVEKVEGSHQFKIMGYSVEKYNEKGTFHESATFSVGGYGWSILYYPNGEMKTEDGYTSIFISLKSETEVTEHVKAQPSFVILNNGNQLLEKRTTPVYTFTSGKKNIGYGFPTFLKKSAFELGLKDDCLVISCSVTVFKTFPVEPDFPLVVPPPIGIKQLSHLLEDGYGADVTFEVNGQTFNAHMCILAMRSKVFRAQFFGPLKEKSGAIIKIEDIEAPVFKSLLDFTYSETIPEFEEINESEKKHNLAQHLLVAADRYDLERLKIICENILYGSINKSNVVSLLLLAERNNCIHLKAACLKLLASPEILGKVVETGQLQSSISVLNTVQEVKQVKLPVQQFNWLDWFIRWKSQRLQKIEGQEDRAKDS